MPATDDQMSREDLLDAALMDVELLEEIRLMSELMVAASNTSGEQLPRHELDKILAAVAATPAPGDDTNQLPEQRLPKGKRR